MKFFLGVISTLLSTLLIAMLLFGPYNVYAAFMLLFLIMVDPKGLN